VSGPQEVSYTLDLRAGKQGPQEDQTQRQPDEEATGSSIVVMVEPVVRGGLPK
jgi:hypothetical protein